jgi:uncharacterized membrane protein YcaP (DUF421 family)
MDTVLRVVVIYVFLLLGMRLIGKREFGQLSPHEFVILLIIPEMVSTALNQDNRSLTNGVLGTATILTLVFITSILTHRSPAFERIVSDAEAVLVHKGELLPEVLDKERVTPSEILAEAHKAGVESIEGIKWAILESDGKIAIVPMKDPGSTRPEESHRG